MITLKQLDDFEHVMSRDTILKRDSKRRDDNDDNDLHKNFREAKAINQRIIYDNYVVGSVYFSDAVNIQMSKFTLASVISLIFFVSWKRLL